MGRNVLEMPLRPWERGKKGYREIGEAWDERPVLRGSPFWESGSEQEAYQGAVEERPIKVVLEEGKFAGYGEGVLDYLQEIVRRATGKEAEAPQLMLAGRVPGEEG